MCAWRRVLEYGMMRFFFPLRRENRACRPRRGGSPRAPVNGFRGRGRGCPKLEDTGMGCEGACTFGPRRRSQTGDSVDAGRPHYAQHLGRPPPSRDRNARWAWAPPSPRASLFLSHDRMDGELLLPILYLIPGMISTTPIDQAPNPTQKRISTPHRGTCPRIRKKLSRIPIVGRASQ
jgi:hypothetical protein